MKILLVFIILVLGIGSYVYFTRVTTEPELVVPAEVVESVPETEYQASTVPAQIAVFENSDYNFSFKYRVEPYGYSIFENTNQQNFDLGTRSGVTLVRTSDYNESVKAADEGNAHDGPPSISVYVLDASAGVDITSWLLSNKMLTNCEVGEVLATVLDDKDASSCLWDGLYLGVTVALLHNNKIYLLIGSREEGENTEGYSYKNDFDEVFNSFSI